MGGGEAEGGWGDGMGCEGVGVAGWGEMERDEAGGGKGVEEVGGGGP